jgi:hypothetical protein
MNDVGKLTSQVRPRAEGRPDAAHFGAGTRHDLRPMLPDEQIAYRKWKRSTLMFYGAVVVILGGLVLTGSSSTAIPDTTKEAGQAMLAVRSR